MYIRLWEPPKQKRRLRIQSRTRFIVFIFIVLTLLYLLIPDWIKDVFAERFEVTKQQLTYWLK